MSDVTTFHDLPYSTPDDALASVDETMQALAERVDYLLGEVLTTDIPMGGTGSQLRTIAFARTYAAAPRVVGAVGTRDLTLNIGSITTSGCDVRISTVSGTSTATVTVTLLVRPLS